MSEQGARNPPFFRRRWRLSLYLPPKKIGWSNPALWFRVFPEENRKNAGPAQGEGEVFQRLRRMTAVRSGSPKISCFTEVIIPFWEGEIKMAAKKDGDNRGKWSWNGGLLQEPPAVMDKEPEPCRARIKRRPQREGPVPTVLPLILNLRPGGQREGRVPESRRIFLDGILLFHPPVRRQKSGSDSLSPALALNRRSFRFLHLFSLDNGGFFLV